jgi:hypothetical protein
VTVPFRRLLYVYIDDRYVGALWTAWPLKRALARAKKVRPDAKSWAIETELRPGDVADVRRPSACGCNDCQATRGEDPGR